MIWFYSGSTIKNESTENFKVFGHVLNNMGFPTKDQFRLRMRFRIHRYVVAPFSHPHPPLLRYRLFFILSSYFHVRPHSSKPQPLSFAILEF
jgi:hypothetical protein